MVVSVAGRDGWPLLGRSPLVCVNGRREGEAEQGWGWVTEQREREVRPPVALWRGGEEGGRSPLGFGGTREEGAGGGVCLTGHTQRGGEKEREKRGV